MLKKILAATLPFVLVFSFSTSGFASITPRYIPCPETSGCRGHVMSGSSIEYLPRYRACPKNSAYQDVALDQYRYDWYECSQCTYSGDSWTLISRGSFTCSH